MSNDRYEKIRAALAMGPTPGPWIVTHELRECDETVCDLVNGTWIVTAPGVKLAHWEYDAAHIAACDPDTIRELMAERDALLDALRQITEWPDGGNRYGQENIKRFAHAAIDAAMRKENSND